MSIAQTIAESARKNVSHQRRTGLFWKAGNAVSYLLIKTLPLATGFIVGAADGRGESMDLEMRAALLGGPTVFNTVLSPVGRAGLKIVARYHIRNVLEDHYRARNYHLTTLPADTLKLLDGDLSQLAYKEPIFSKHMLTSARNAGIRTGVGYAMGYAYSAIMR